MTAAPRIAIEIHPKFQCLLTDKHTFANIYGGRGGMKSEQVHKVALLDAIDRPIITCCARETKTSMKNSSHKLLATAIHDLGMAKSQNGPYEVQADRIIRKERDIIESEFIFVGIREDVRNNKSLKGVGRTIVEEGAEVSEDSWDVLIPTVIGRVEGSQLWVIWNPETTTDATYKLFMLNPPTDTIHITTTYLENPWLSDQARQLAEDCKRDFPLKYAHIWMGEPNTDVEGAYFEHELAEARAMGRIGEIPYNRTKPVNTAWDLGFDDPSAIWFYQAYDGFYNFIDYFEGNKRTLANYLVVLQNRGYVYDTDWLPWDAVSGRIHSNLTADKTTSPDSLMRAAGRKVRVAPDLGIESRINFARTVFPQCRFDAEKCRDGLAHLARYQPEPAPLTGIKRGIKSGRDLHNEASHAGTAFCCAAVGMRQPLEEVKRSVVEEEYQEPYAPFG
jgi:phage terminase large subunit